uniref:Uncharacterized protein n=1 Tax=Knipowitschia caucasica TaxID=637954 RepID=A0AAV2LY66_KNICA
MCIPVPGDEDTRSFRFALCEAAHEHLTPISGTPRKWNLVLTHVPWRGSPKAHAPHIFKEKFEELPSIASPLIPPSLPLLARAPELLAGERERSPPPAPGACLRHSHTAGCTGRGDEQKTDAVLGPRPDVAETWTE